MATDIYADRVKRFVVLEHPTVTSVKLCYCFPTPVKATDVDALGQVAITSETVFPHPAIAGASGSVYPAKMKNLVTGVSSLCSTASIASARAAGWSRAGKSTFQARRTQTTTGFTSTSRGSVIVMVQVSSSGGNINYGWYMQKKRLAKIPAAELTALGISFPTSDADWASLVIGADLPRPPRASKTIIENATGKTDTISAFYSDTVTALPEGWVHNEDMKPFTEYFA